MTPSKMLRALSERGLISEQQKASIEAVDGEPGTPASPWYVQVVLGICAWIAGLLLLAFAIIGLGDIVLRHDNWTAILVIGVCACACAGFLYAAVGEQSAFGSQFALAMSLAGQAGIAVGLGNLSNERVTLWGMVIVEAALAAGIPNRLHRVLTSFGTIVAWGLATYEILFGELPGVSFWGHAPQSYTFQLTAISVVLWLVVWAPVGFAAYWLVRNEARWMAAGRESLLRPVTHGVVAALSIAPLFTHPATFWMALGFGNNLDISDGSLNATALWPLLAMLLSLFALALAFAVRSRPLMGLTIIFALIDVSSFYYVLGTTLLVKSILMVVLGAGLIAAAQWLRREPVA